MRLYNSLFADGCYRFLTDRHRPYHNSSNLHPLRDVGRISASGNMPALQLVR